MNIELKHQQNEANSSLSLYEGKAPEQPSNVPACKNINGCLNAPLEFFKGQKENFNTAASIVIINIDKGTIQLEAPANGYGLESPYCHNISGSLQHNPGLTAFGINSQKTWPSKALIKHLRFNKIHFMDAEEHTALLEGITKMKASISSNFEEQTDQRGNKRNWFEKQVTTNIKTDFVLSMPVYKGLTNSLFKVEVCMDATDNNIQFWLESVELAQLQHELKFTLLQAVKKAFEEYHITILEE